ncbi:MAG: antibiotic biosynthesis monooxygenase [Tepidiformaceae bacterium]
MTYIRLSLARPRNGETAKHLEELFRQLAELTSSEDGCLQSYLLRPHDDSGEIARIALYRDEKAAERAAAGESVMALRSQLDLAIEPRSHQERAFFTID